MSGYYILDGKRPRAVSVMDWAQWIEKNDRRLAFDQIGEAEVSTVFLGSDHGFGTASRPVLFETMVFGGVLDGTQVRYTDYDQALAGHQATLALVKAAGNEAQS